MRKLILQVQITVDGFIAGPAGEMDFMEWNWDEGIKQYVEDLMKTVHDIVLGRKLAEGFIPYWASVAADPENPEQEAGKIFSNSPKMVFSRTLEDSKWPNTVLAKGDLKEEIQKLKQQEGKDIIAYGGAEFVSSLIKESLIDEFHLFINPVLIGKGLAIFNDLQHIQKLKLLKANAFDCGIVVMHYRLAN